MLHDGEMTEQGGAWERLDVAAVTPNRGGDVASSGESAGALRLRRSRGPVLAGMDGGGAIFQRRLRDVLVGAAAILAPALVLNVAVGLFIFNRVDPNDPSLPSFFRENASTGVEDMAVFAAIVLESFVTAVVGYFCAQILIGERFRAPVTMGRALLRTLKRTPAIFAAWLITHWWFVLGVVLIVAADREAAGGLIFLFVFVAWFSSAASLLVIPVMVGEGRGPFAAAKRNFALIKLRYGVCLIFVLVATLLASLLLLGIGTLMPALQSLGFVTFGDANGVVQGVMVQIAVLFVVPLIALGTAQVYLEIRLAGEGLDLMIDTDNAFGPRPTP